MEVSSPTKDIKEAEAEQDELDGDYESDDGDLNSFKVHDSLEPASAKIYSTRELHALIHEGTIDLTPPYQRDVVWPETKQIGLIDSIFRNFYVPPIVFAVQNDEEGEEVRVCVDGKQRLTSIQKFFDGQIPHRDSRTKKLWWFTTSEMTKPSRNEVPGPWKEIFAAKQITCVEYHGLSPGSERDIFQRVQLGVTLTAAEKLQAISSPWAEWISELETRHVTVDGGLAEILEWDTKRGRDFQNVAYFVCCCDHYPGQQHVPTAQKIEKWLSRIDRPTEQLKAEIESVLSDYWKIAKSPAHNYGFTKIGKRLAPVEFIFIGVMLYVMREAQIEDRARAILDLRQNIREEFKDVRNNSSVVRYIWRLIDKIRGNPSVITTSDNETGAGKRKRKSGVDEDEYKPEPIKSLGKTPTTRSKQSRVA